MNSASKMHSSSSSSSSRDGEDIISSLPNHILVGILSFLDTKHAVQTTILSKRWRNVWTCVGCLTFDIELFYSPTTNQYVGFQNFVDQVLIRRDHNSNIYRFNLVNNNQDFDIKNHLNPWILSAIRMKVKDLHIVVRGAGLGLPNSLFTCNSLTRLLLSMVAGNHDRWSIVLPDSMCLPNLQVLDLYTLLFHDENLTNKFFSSCPDLRELNLTNVEFLRMNVNISCHSLRTFTLDNLEYCTWPDTKFKLHAPRLSYFSCKDYLSNDYSLDICSFVKADFYMRVEEEDQNPESYSKLPAEKKQMYAQRMVQCLKELLFVKDLKLSAWFLEVFSGSPDLLEAECVVFIVLSILRLETCLSSDSIRAIAYLFKISPKIKSLFVEISQIKFGSSNPEAEVSMQGLLDELELVEIQGAVGCANELKFLEILLKNAKILKKLVVYASKEDSPNREERMKKFTEKLLTFPKASSDITILFI